MALLLAGTGVGWLAGGRTGALWGAGIGVLLGILAAAALTVFMRRANRR